MHAHQRPSWAQQPQQTHAADPRSSPDVNNLCESKHFSGRFDAICSAQEAVQVVDAHEYELRGRSLPPFLFPFLFLLQESPGPTLIICLEVDMGALPNRCC